MRAEVSSPFARVVDRLGRARRDLARRGAGPRWAVAAAGVAALAAIAYAATAVEAPAGGFVRAGERFSSDELTLVGNALSAKGLRYNVNDLRQVEVAADSLVEANAVVAKLAVGRQPLAEIDRKTLEFNPWDSLAANGQRQELAANQRIAEMIRPLDGVVSAHVTVYPKKARGLRSAAEATAFVYLQTERDRELSSATLESIQVIVSGNAPDVKPDAVTVCDARGRVYADARNPSLGDRTRTRTYRDELRQEIQNNLDWLRGARVSVQVLTPPPVAPPAAATATPTPPAAEPAPAPALAPAAEGFSAEGPTVGVNQPLDLAPESPPALPPEPVAPPAPAVAPVVELTGPPRVRVLVEVPRSYYLNAFPRREPSLDDLHPFMERTKMMIETAVRHVVPADHLDEVEVINISDVSATREPAAPPGVDDSRRDLTLWVSVGVAVGSLGAVLLMALRAVTGRRPAAAISARTGDGRTRYKIDEASDAGQGPGPSERVRELIRLSPEAAASVLNRWTQGGTNG